MTLKGGLIGCGYISEPQLRAWSQIKDVEIIAVCDLERKKAAERADQFQIRSVYSDYGEMLAREDLDFVDIATGPETHLKLVSAAAAQGLQILCQKPMANTMDDAKRMVDICGESGVMFMINENARHQAWFRKMKELLRDGTLGTPYYARFESRSRASLPSAEFKRQPYLRYMPRLVVFEEGVHFLDVARFLLGDPKVIFAYSRRISPLIQGEDTAIVMVEFENAVCIVDISWCAFPAPGPEVSWGPARLDGTEGSVLLSRDGRLLLSTDSGSNEWVYGTETIEQSFTDTQRHFIDCLHSDEEPETSGEYTLGTMAMVFAAYEAADKGASVPWEKLM